MRGILLSLAVLVAMSLATPPAAVPLMSAIPATVTAAELADVQQPDAPDLKVDINVDDDAGAWYTNPMWLAIGGVALLVLILIVVFAARGSGTTVIKE